MILRTFWLFFLPIFLVARVPDLNESDVKYQIANILKHHARHKEINKEVAGRVLELFIEELDSSKIYFTKPEIEPYLHPSSDLLEKVISEYKDNSYATMQTIFELMQASIKRRMEIENSITPQQIPQVADNERIKDNDWVGNKQELKDKVLLVKGLRKRNIKHLTEEHQDNFQKRLVKYRNAMHEKVLGEKQKSHFYSVVLKATSASLDSQTNYFTPQEATHLMIQVQGRLFGIGAQLQDDLDGLKITRLVEGGPALRGGQLNIGDKIVAVDGEVIIGMSINDSVDLIRGEKGKPVALTVLRQVDEEDENGAKIQKKFDVSIVRDEIIFEQGRIESKPIPFGDGAIGYVRLHSFYEDDKASSAKDIKEQLLEMQKEHDLSGVILDLRDNTGGLLTQAVEVAGLFIEKGIVVSVKDALGRVQHLRNLSMEPVFDGPLMIVTNCLSASASEIVAGTLQDYGRALIVGETTFGKGSFQRFTLNGLSPGRVNPKGEYKVTEGIYYTVSGRSPQLVGIEKDIEVLGPYSSMEIGEKFSKFPLQPDSITPNFEDDFSDVAFLQRDKVRRLYKLGHQKKMEMYQAQLKTLSKNSQLRISQNSRYQKDLEQLKNEDYFLDVSTESFMNSVQLEEAINILKDYILLSSQSKHKQAA